MNRIDKIIHDKSRELLNIYFTAGYPHLDDTRDIILALDRAGTDIIEIGMPYSDPMADGPTIQESGTAAITNGMTLETLFGQLDKIREETQVPLLLMGYLNQVMQYGLEAFVASGKRVGIDGLIIPDLPMDIYEEEIKDIITEAGLHMIFLITPQTSSERIRKIDQLAGGFIYMVSSASITGARQEITPAQLDYFYRVNDMDLKNPRLIGFGISNHQTFQQACEFARGAIIGSAFIKHLAANKDRVVSATEEFVHSIRNEVSDKALS